MSRAARLRFVLALNLVLLVGLLAVGLSSHSLGLLAEGADYLADAAAIGLSLLAIRLADRPPTPRRPHGYPRATALAALANGGWLLILSLAVIAGAIDRLATGARAVDGLAVLVASGIAAAVMLAGALVLGADRDGADLNLSAVLLDTAADAATAAGVAIAGAVILAAGGLYWLDPAVALAVSAIVAYHAVRLLQRIGRVLRSALGRV